MTIDFGKTTGDYSHYRKGFPDSFFVRIEQCVAMTHRTRILDLGTGTGTIARGFARRGYSVTGIDKSQEMIHEAIRLSREENLDIQYRTVSAEQIDLSGNSFDLVIAGQCWHWFDRPSVAREVIRLLVASGFFVIAHYDWIPLQGNVVELTEQLIVQYNPSWNMYGGSGIYPAWFTDVADAGFKDIQSFTYDTVEHYTQDSWRGRVRASAGIAASLSDEGVRHFDMELNRVLRKKYGENDLDVPHRVFVLLCNSPEKVIE